MVLKVIGAHIHDIQKEPLKIIKVFIQGQKYHDAG